MPLYNFLFFKSINLLIVSILFVGFLFHTVPKSEKLSTEDAKFVDVIHSAGLWIGTDEVVCIHTSVSNIRYDNINIIYHIQFIFMLIKR